MRTILVLRGGALGDFIVTLPALAALRQQWPAARIELAGNATAAALARTRGLLDVVHSQHESRWSALYGDAPLPTELAAWLAQFDLVLSYWPDPDGELARRFPLRPGQQFLTAPAMPTRAPAAAHYCEPLRALGLEIRDYFFPLEVGRVIPNPPPQDSRTPFQIAIHPGSGSPRKNWPFENWCALLPQLPAPVTVILGEAELDRWGPLSAAGLSSNVRTVLQSPSLEELVARFSHTDLFLGHDSGISHLAAACRVPSLLLFGPTDPKTWAPPAPHVRVLQRGNDLSAINVADVLDASLAALGRANRFR